MQASHFLQSQAWGDFQRALGREVVAGEGWQAIVMGSKGFKYLYAPYIQVESHKSKVTSLVGQAKQRGMDFVRIDSVDETPSGAKKVADMQPSRTWVLDISKGEDELRAGMASGHRNAINGAERRGISFRVSTDPAQVEIMLTMLKATGFKTHSSEYYQVQAATLLPAGAARLFIAEAEGAPVAAAMSFEFNGTTYYAHAASTEAGKKLQAAAPLVWFMITEAKKQESTKFDFWGIAPEDQPNHPWAGFTRFKQAFGGQAVDYAGTWDVPVKPAKYALYTLARKFKK